jgi:hypothetical protein
MRIYIHHYYTEHLFYLLAHNTSDRIFEISNNLGNVRCKYKNIDVEFIFKLELSDEIDGYHLIDLSTLRKQTMIDPKFKDITASTRNVPTEINNQENNCIYNLSEMLKDKNNYIFTFFCGEKSLYKFEGLQNHRNIELLQDLENSLCRLTKFKILFEEVFLKDEIRLKYPNFHFAFSNVMWYWNNHAEIRLYYEFKDIYNKLNFEYDLCYSMRAHKYHRVLLLNELKKLNQKGLYIQRSDGRKESEEFIKYDKKVQDIYMNSSEGENDFENLNLINKQRVGLDLFFRLLPKAKMHILDESWAFSKGNFASHYLSEKTIGFILSGIPFISTHSYPLEIVQKMLKVSPHPFLEESRKIQGDAVMVSKFIDEFLNNFEENFIICKKWIDECHNAFMKKLLNENSLLDLIVNGFEENKIEYKKNFI